MGWFSTIDFIVITGLSQGAICFSFSVLMDLEDSSM
jgi:hypothetical protein